MTEAWSKWLPFPDPKAAGILTAPLGPGCYELRRRSSGKPILFGMSGHVASRISSLLPTPDGTGTRNNSDKREYVLKHLDDIEYRTTATLTRPEAVKIEGGFDRRLYKFRT